MNLEDVRRGALELLREQITTNPERAPDVGPAQVHESAGAIAVGARPFLIAFNVILRTTTSPSRARSRARSARNGGLPFVKALGFHLHTRGLVQVSMNLVNYEVTGMTAVYNAINARQCFGVSRLIALRSSASSHAMLWIPPLNTSPNQKSSNTKSISADP